MEEKEFNLSEKEIESSSRAKSISGDTKSKEKLGCGELFNNNGILANQCGETVTNRKIDLCPKCQDQLNSELNHGGKNDE